jgi:hypothetical protein
MIMIMTSCVFLASTYHSLVCFCIISHLSFLVCQRGSSIYPSDGRAILRISASNSLFLAILASSSSLSVRPWQATVSTSASGGQEAQLYLCKALFQNGNLVELLFQGPVPAGRVALLPGFRGRDACGISAFRWFCICVGRAPARRRRRVRVRGARRRRTAAPLSVAGVRTTAPSAAILCRMTFPCHRARLSAMRGRDPRIRVSSAHIVKLFSASHAIPFNCSAVTHTRKKNLCRDKDVRTF